YPHFSWTFHWDTMHFCFKGPRGFTEDRGCDIIFSYALDPAQMPKAIDMKPTKGEGTALPIYLGIYHLDGNNLKLCYSPKQRPTEFATQGKPDRMLFIMKRGSSVPRTSMASNKPD